MQIPSNISDECADALDKLRDKWAKQLSDAGKPDKEAAERNALTTYCHAIMNSAG